MPFFPTMYALLNVDRLRRGLPDLQLLEHYVPEEETQGFHWFPATDHRHKPLRQLMQSLPDDLIWLNERGVVHDGGPDLQPHDFERVLKFLLRGPDPLDFVDVEIAEDSQVPLRLDQRKQWATAEVNFHGDGLNWKFTLATTHPAHDNMRTFLTAVQPVHCMVAANSVYLGTRKGDFGFGYFPRAWMEASINCFLGPKLVRRIPPDLLTQEAGLAYVARLGDGVWITLLDDDRHQDEEMVGRHLQAIKRINEFMPPASPFNPSNW